MNWVISDIHGCYDAFIMLKNKIEKKDKNAVIIIAGDILDRGPKVAEMLEWCMENCNRMDGRYILLMGNHEELAIEWYEESFVYWEKKERNKGELMPDTMFDFAVLVNKNKWSSSEILKPKIDFLKSLPFYYFVNTEKKKYLIVHAWAPKSKRMEEIISGSEITSRDKNIFLWERRDGDFYKSEDVYLVHGHTPTANAYSKKNAEIYKFKNVTNIDCGCVWHMVGGRLAALCLETEKVLYQQYI